MPDNSFDVVSKVEMPEVVNAKRLCQNTTADVLYQPAWQRYQHHYAKLNGQFSQVYPGVLEGLKNMQQAGWRLATRSWSCCLTRPAVASCSWLGGRPRQRL